MPWKESSAMDERLRFVARILEGEPMTGVCRAFGISHCRAQTLSRLAAVRGHRWLWP